MECIRGGKTSLVPVAVLRVPSVNSQGCPSLSNPSYYFCPCDFGCHCTGGSALFTSHLCKLKIGTSELVTVIWNKHLCWCCFSAHSVVLSRRVRNSNALRHTLTKKQKLVKWRSFLWIVFTVLHHQRKALHWNTKIIGILSIILVLHCWSMLYFLLLLYFNVFYYSCDKLAVTCNAVIKDGHC